MSDKIGKPCPYCHTIIKPTQQTRVCPACSATFHVECWNENKGCAVFGCSQNPLTSVKNTGKHIDKPVDPNSIYLLSGNVALAVFIFAVSSVFWFPWLIGCR